MSDIKILIKQ